MIQLKRRLQGISGSLFVSLPRSWTKQYKLEKGSTVDIELAKGGQLVLAPSLHQKKETWNAKIVYNELFYRKFFREYLAGNDFITVVFRDEISPEERKKLYSFLDLMMNVQIVEESSNQLVLQSFKLTDLSVRSCLKRMFYLTQTMFDELISINDTAKIKELDAIISKYYYVLILQIRRFLEEGKFTHESDMTIIDSVDIRMIAEKIERIGDIIKHISDSGMSKELIPLAKLIFDKYKKAANSHFTNNFNKAASLWQDEIKVTEAFQLERGKYLESNSIEEIESLNKLFDVFKFAKEIANIVR